MVVNICASKPNLGNRPLATLMTATLNAWAEYSYFRGRIPYESEWYRSIYRQKKWLMANDMEISLALNTQTTLQPEVRKNRNWLEAELLPIVSLGLLALLNRKDVQSAHEGLIHLSTLVRYLARQLDTTNLGAFQQMAKQLADRWFKLGAEGDDNKRVRDDREEIGLADSLGMFPISATLGLADWASSFDFEAFEKSIGDTDWSGKKAAYLSGFPYGMLGHLEQLQEKLAFEISIEGKRISPNWYVCDIIYLGLLKALKPCLDEIGTTIDTTLINNSKSFFESKRYRSSAALTLRGLEFLEKILQYFALRE